MPRCPPNRRRSSARVATLPAPPHLPALDRDLVTAAGGVLLLVVALLFG